MLSLVDICKSQGRGKQRVQVLRDVSLSVAEGEIVGVLGPRHDEEGATLLRVAGCLTRPDTGRVRLDGIDVTRLSNTRRDELRCRHTLWVDRQLMMPMVSNVHGYVRLSLLGERKISVREASQRAQLGLERLGASDLARSRLGRLTFWERVLVEFARIAATRPRFVVIYDLFAGFGVAHAQEARRLLRSLVDDIGCGVLLKAPDVTSVWVANRVWRFDRGDLMLVADTPSSDRNVVALELSRAGSEYLSHSLAGRSSSLRVPSQASVRIEQMPTISRFLGITISMYFDDHQPPHFHARSGEFNAKIRTDTLELLVGDLPRRELRLVLAWAELHASELQDNWRRARAGETLLEVEPL